MKKHMRNLIPFIPILGIPITLFWRDDLLDKEGVFWWSAIWQGANVSEAILYFCG